ncbi:MAG TPA: hypothetical protein PLD23_16235 [Armatimonadota bacterium]|nr:hypothetical protein [Armatimonadota bacterium]HQK95056.1 hypothetical protein [Armatimonadota bacterium]
MRVTLRNEFHRTRAEVVVPTLPHTLSASQYRRALRALCPCRAGVCQCGGLRGPQSVGVELTADANGRPTWRLSAREELAP